ncbi:MAG: SLC13 family permease [Planctomycetota bacterium]|jgi:di/tricarboxylate transporter
MDVHGWIALGTLVAAILLFVTRLIPLEATALAIPVVLAATGTLEKPETAFAGFSNLAVIAIGAVFIVGGGLKESGVATIVARGIEKAGGRSESLLILLIMAATCVLSAFMSSAATVAVFLPVIAALSRRTLIPSSHLMLPLGYAAVMGGTLTLIGTTPNLILGADLAVRTEGKLELGMFEFAKVGVPVSVLGILFMVTIGRRLLPERSSEDRLQDAQVPEEVARSYGLAKNFYRMRVVAASPLAGASIADAEIRQEYDLVVLMVFRPGNLRRRWMTPRPDLVLEPNDEVYLEGEAEAAWRISEEKLLQFGVAGPRSLRRVLGHGVTMAEAILSPHSQVPGKTLRDLEFRNRYGLNVLALWRNGKAVTRDVADRKLQLGDALLVSGRPARLRHLAEDPDYLVLSDDSRIEDVRRAPLALLLLLVAIVPPIVGWLPLAVSAMGSALLMIGTRCISLTGARRCVDFRVLFLIIGTIPLGTALEEQGLAEAVAVLITDVGGVLGTPGTLLVLFGLASILSTTVNNGAAAVILAPVAFKVATATGLDLHQAFLAVAIGASCVFTLPFGNQCNLMVMGPGGYTPKDFLRAGSGLALVMAVTTVLVLSVW